MWDPKTGLHPEPDLIEKSTYREYDMSSLFISENSFLNNAKKILVTDDNIKPMHIQIPAEHTEFHVIRNSDTLFVNVGESWTYGEALENIGTGIGKFNFRNQLQGCFGPRIAEVMGWDLYQFAIPGNCNLYMHLDLARILRHVATLGYKKVYVSMQMTEPGRELVIPWTKLFQQHAINDWYNIPKDREIHIVDWLALYDELFFDSFNNLLNSFTACPIEGIMWRNFTRIATQKRNYNFKFIEPTWIVYTAKLCNVNIDPPYILNAIETDAYSKNIGPKLILPRDWMEDQIDKVNFMFDYIAGKVAKSLIYHSNHPTKTGHLVWAHHLIRQAGWKDV